MTDNDYTRWADNATYMSEEVDTLASDAPDPDMEKLVLDAADKIREALALAEERA